MVTGVQTCALPICLGAPSARQKYKPKYTLAEARQRKAQEKMNKAIGQIEQGGSIRRVSRRFHVSRERVSTRLKELEMVAPLEAGKSYQLIAAARREMTTYSNGGIDIVHLSFGEASRNSYYLHTVYRAMNGDPLALRVLQNMVDDHGDPEGVTDVYGVFHPWELNIDVVRRMTLGGNIPEIYRLV
jgi:AraC-like DNA-binding protein